MNNSQNIVTLRVNDKDYGGWKSVSICAGIERQVRDFTLDVTRRWPDSPEPLQRLRKGDKCEVRIGNDLVLTGYIDGTPINYSGQQISIGVTGRSKTEDLVDCSAINMPGQWRGQKLETIARALAEPYGIKVVTETDTGDPIADHVIERGESVFESIDRMLRQRHVLATDNASGDLVFIEPGTDHADTALEYGKNILSAGAGLDSKGVYSEYRAYGQQASGGNGPGLWADVVVKQEGSSAPTKAQSNLPKPAPKTIRTTSAHNTFASAVDPSVTRQRVKIFKQSGNADEGTCADRVEYERASRSAAAIETTYTVQGWRQASGRLWLPNMRVKVHDPIIGFDGELLIAEIEYRLDESGTVALLKVGPVDGYTSKAPKSKKKGSGKGGGGDGSVWSDVKVKKP